MASQKDPVKEYIIFGIMFGVVLGVLAFLALRIPASAPPLLGMPRNVAIAVPAALIALGFLAGGIALAKTRSPAAVRALIVCGVVLAISEIAFGLLALGKLLAFKLVSIVIYLVPILLISRSGPVFRALEDEEGRRAG